MKLGKVTHNDPLSRQTVSLHRSTVEQINAYQAYYQSVHGDEISMSLLIEEMVKRFMKEDRDFVRFTEAATRVPAAEPAAKAPAGRTLGLKN